KHKLSLTIEKIPETNVKTVDFIIKDKSGSPIALFECTTFNLTINDAKRLNSPLAGVLKTPYYLAPELYLSKDYLTTFLGFDDLKNKIREKCTQFDEYINKNPGYSNLDKYIILDLSWFVFDERINNACFHRIINDWNNIYRLGKDYDEQSRIINIITSMRTELEKHNISLLLYLNHLNYGIDCLIVVNQYKIYTTSWYDLITKTDSYNEAELIYDKKVIDGFCENSLFYTKKSKIHCHRFTNFVHNFLNDYFKLSLQNISLEKNDWANKINSEITYYSNLLKKYEPETGEVPVLKQLTINSSLEEYPNAIVNHNIICLFHSLHYIFENLFFQMKSRELIGYKTIAFQICLHYFTDTYNTIRSELISNGMIQDSLKTSFHDLVMSLNLEHYNNINCDQYQLPYFIIQPIFV
ncbi:MAG: hypothetical protein K0R49_1796, partial [Burkholderiales bacterium]|nr:hypothetical protein [Burkholderiales bacterium]